MKDASPPRTTRLTDYLIEQGAGADLRAQAAIFAKICNGALPAFITVHPKLPAGASALDIQRYANAHPREVSALSDAKAKAEIRMAAMGQNPDWALLDTLTVHVPAAPDRVVKPAAKTLRPAERERIILKAIEDAGLDRYAIAKPKRGARTGDRDKVWRTVPGSMEKKDFENSWAKMEKAGAIRFTLAS